jgi:hypothetical protein
MFIPLLPVALALGSLMEWLSFTAWFDVLSRVLLLGILWLAMIIVVPKTPTPK